MNDLIIKDLNDVMQIAQVFTRARLFKDTVDMNQAAVKIMAGHEMGIAPFAAMTGLSIIQGKVAVGANIMAAKVKESGKYDYSVVQNDDKACILKFFENGKEVGESPFTIEDAKKAGLLSKDIWHKYPRNMLFARAISNGQRWFCPGVLGKAAVYTPEELESIPVEQEINPVIEHPRALANPVVNEVVEEFSLEKRKAIIDRLHALDVDVPALFEHYQHSDTSEFTNDEMKELIELGKRIKAAQSTPTAQQEELARSL